MPDPEEVPVGGRRTRNRVLRRALLVLAVLTVAFVGTGQLIVWFGTSWSPDDGIPWPGMDSVWLFVEEGMATGELCSVRGAEVRVNGRYVGSTLGGGPSLAVNVWRFREYEITVSKPGLHTWRGNIRSTSLSEVGPGPYRGLDVVLEREQAAR